MDQLFQQHGQRRVERQQRHQHRHHGRQQQQAKRPPMRFVRQHMTVDFQPAIDCFGRLACIGTWTGLATLILFLVLHG